MSAQFLAPDSPAYEVVRRRVNVAYRDVRPQLVALLGEARTSGRQQLMFIPMGGAYNRIAPDATAFAHRGERFLLQHIGEADDPWVDRSWATAHAEASGHAYVNFPDPGLDDWAAAYHGDNYDRLVAVKQTYDPQRFFDFPQAI